MIEKGLLWGNFGGKFSGISSKRVSNVPFVYSKFCTYAARAVMLKNAVLLQCFKHFPYNPPVFNFHMQRKEQPWHAILQSAQSHSLQPKRRSDFRTTRSRIFPIARFGLLSHQSDRGRLKTSDGSRYIFKPDIFFVLSVWICFAICPF